MSVKEKEIIFLEPVFKEMIWGGNRLRTEFNYEIPSEHTGECWAISAHKNGDCKIKSDRWSGMYLSQLFHQYRNELFGGVEGDVFPLLIKIIDAKEDLSIQVHPEDEYAKANENGSLGKTECWYILNCEPGGSIIIGHNAKDKNELKSMIENQEWKDLIREIPIKKGDFFQINPGTVHAIKGGTMILETQQNSDITYRLYDYDRLQNGVKRELHIDKSIDVIVCPHKDYKEGGQEDGLSGSVQQLISCDYYTVRKITLAGREEFTQKESFTLMSVIEGDGEIDGIPVKKGDHFILPFGYGNYTIDGTITIIQSYC